MAGVTRGGACLSRFYSQKGSLLQFLFLEENSLDLLHFDENEVWVCSSQQGCADAFKVGF